MDTVLESFSTFVHNLSVTTKLLFRCGMALIEEQLADVCPASSHGHEEGRTVAVLIDVPVGWVLRQCEQFSEGPFVVVTANPCPEYVIDLYDAGALKVIGDVPLEDIQKEAMAEGDYGIDKPRSALAPIERYTLRLIAEAYTNAEIAAARGVSEQVVKNTIRSIYQKLDIKSRTGAAHYYLGQWCFTNRYKTKHYNLRFSSAADRFS